MVENIVYYKMKNKKYHSVESVQKSDWNIVERGKNETPNTYIHDRSLSWLGTDTSIVSGCVKLVLWTQTASHSEMLWLGKCFPHESKMATVIQKVVM